MTRTRITTMMENGPPPEAAGTLYVGDVMHARLRPLGHRFTYKVFSLLVDIDRLHELARATPLLGVNRRGIVAFRETDHTERAGESLRDHADRLFAGAGLERPSRVLLLCYPRVFGYVFNPISVFFGYDARGTLTGLIYAVRNTFGERHAYVAPVAAGEMTASGVRQTRSKRMHVSPFMEMRAAYHFRVLPPGEALRLRIHQTENGEPTLAATFSGEAAPLSTRALTTFLLKIPFLTWKIMAGIHWEALKLWLKGARFHKSPPAPAPASYGDGIAALPPGE